MKKFLFSIAALLMAFTANAQDLKLTTNNPQANPGGDVDLIVSLENNIETAGWQMYLYCPEGVTTTLKRLSLTDRYEQVWSEDDEEYIPSHQFMFQKTGESLIPEGYANGYVINCFATPPTLLKGNSGEIVKISLKVADTYAGEDALKVLIDKFAVADLTGYQTSLGESITTAIDFITNNKEVENGAIYNLKGQRVEKAGKGLYIVNGQKVVK